MRGKAVQKEEGKKEKDKKHTTADVLLVVFAVGLIIDQIDWLITF